MRVIEGGHGATLPTILHAATHLFLYLLDGTLEMTIDGEAHVVAGGDAVNLPAGTAYATRILSGTARWLAASSGGNGGTFWDSADTITDGFAHIDAPGGPWSPAANLDVTMDAATS